MPGEDTISATLTNQAIGSVSHTATDNVEANIENASEELTGTLAFNETTPAEIFVGDDLTLKFMAPVGN